jgi:hypothetical protein
VNIEQEIATRLNNKYGPAVDCDGIAALVYSYILAERERCAKVAESLYDVTFWDDPSAGIAAHIRSGQDPRKNGA